MALNPLAKRMLEEAKKKSEEKIKRKASNCKFPFKIYEIEEKHSYSLSDIIILDNPLIYASHVTVSNGENESSLNFNEYDLMFDKEGVNLNSYSLNKEKGILSWKDLKNEKNVEISTYDGVRLKLGKLPFEVKEVNILYTTPNLEDSVKEELDKIKFIYRKI
jgi:hypothetical protein